jgi:cytosine/adenosine deaminase-related metal-dependent hydrolase
MPDTIVRRALKGRIVTMKANTQPIPSGIIYIEDNSIVAVSPADAPTPANFNSVPIVDSGGTIYPGIIELHNHLSYNALKLWNVPKKYTNRDDWPRHPDYRKLISGPMNVLGQTPSYPEAVVRFVECKCLLGGVTTSQGIALFSNAGIVRYYRGLVRNVEQTAGTGMPGADAKISDVVASDVNKFFEHLQKVKCLLLHLSEGTDERAHAHFESLKLADGSFAITNALAGIHCVKLSQQDFHVLRQDGGSMVWSPLSNLLLYGQTADVKAAKAENVMMGLGSDWSPSGSKNLFGELKVAHLVSNSLNQLFTDEEIIAMATRNAASIIKWDKAIGTLEAGKRADLIVVDGQSGDAYSHLIKAKETDLHLVMIDGVPRFGTSTLMKGAGTKMESWSVGSQKRKLNLAQVDADPMVGKLTLKDAIDHLKDGLHRLKELAKATEKPTQAAAFFAAGATRWRLQLDHEEPQGLSLRPRFATERGKKPNRISEIMQAAAQPLSQLLGPLELDAITVADDAGFLPAIQQQKNLPDFIKTGLPQLY